MKHFHSYLPLLFIVTLLSADNNKSYQIDHLEPPFWWTSMADNTLHFIASTYDPQSRTIVDGLIRSQPNSPKVATILLEF